MFPNFYYNLRKETDPVSESFCQSDDGQSPKPSKPECLTLSLEIFRIFFYKFVRELRANLLLS
jgi:hypothetical protein